MSELPPAPMPEPPYGGGLPPGQEPPGIYGPQGGYGQPPPGYGQQQQQPPPYGQPGYGYGPNPGPNPNPGYGQYPGYGYRPYGVVPRSLGEVYYNSALNILLFAVTCGIWGGIWSWRTHDDLQKYNGDGLGGVVGLILGLLLSAAVMFTIPNEIEKMYQRDGRQSPVSTLWGLWFLLPIIGHFVWYLNVQGALNDFWLSKGTQPG